MRIVFMGTADFGEKTLRALSERHDIAAVVTLCDACRGRGRRMLPTPIKKAALSLNLDVIEQDDLRDPAFIKQLGDLHADLFIVVAFRILPQEVFTIPTLGTVNLHASLLPDYRGAAPIQWAVINGDTVTGLTAFYIKETVDTGDIILQSSLDIGKNETTGELHDRMATHGADLMVDAVAGIESGRAARTTQPMTGGRRAPRLFKKDGRINWTWDAAVIHNRVRGMNPVPGTFTDTESGPLKIHRTTVVDTSSTGRPGEILECAPDTGMVVQCGKGRLRLTEVQPPGKRSMETSCFLLGRCVETGKLITEL